MRACGGVCAFGGDCGDGGGLKTANASDGCGVSGQSVVTE